MLEFKTFRGASMNEYNQIFIRDVFKQLSDPNSFYTNLQIIYNNSHHFQTVPFDLCTTREINSIAKKANSTSKTLVVQGNIHTNHHSSGVLVDAYSGRKLFVEDTYIRIKDNETSYLFHVLVNPPKINHPVYLFNPKQGCNVPSYFIPPMFNFLP